MSRREVSNVEFELRSISRPGSVRRLATDSSSEQSQSPSASEDEEDGSTSEGYGVDEDEDPLHEREGSIFRDKSDTRSIRSFSSMMSGRDRDPDDGGSRRDKNDRPSLSDRLANMGALRGLAVRVLCSTHICLK